MSGSTVLPWNGWNVIQGEQWNALTIRGRYSPFSSQERAVGQPMQFAGVPLAT